MRFLKYIPFLFPLCKYQGETIQKYSDIFVYFIYIISIYNEIFNRTKIKEEFTQLPFSEGIQTDKNLTVLRSN